MVLRKGHVFLHSIIIVIYMVYHLVNIIRRLLYWMDFCDRRPRYNANNRKPMSVASHYLWSYDQSAIPEIGMKTSLCLIFAFLSLVSADTPPYYVGVGRYDVTGPAAEVNMVSKSSSIAIDIIHTVQCRDIHTLHCMYLCTLPKVTRDNSIRV